MHDSGLDKENVPALHAQARHEMQIDCTNLQRNVKKFTDRPGD
ncbi:hypothetical protein HNQ64_004275 [Prosthecobacter dejongeii]|uniref:Uncharacterized protein n=1 Tax=Prosthecobacter dejongeii TaxID=48465 RepID=A0A7W8DSM8_9BACT|nr:hypothetical protein [Prosthecobacter dejongeii]